MQPGIRAMMAVDQTDSHGDGQRIRVFQRYEMCIRDSINRDVFVFCAFTGLSHADVVKLTHADIHTDYNLSLIHI